MVHLKTIFWTTIVWLFLFAAGVAYLRLFDTSLVYDFFPSEQEAPVCDTTETTGDNSMLMDKIEELTTTISELQSEVKETKSSVKNIGVPVEPVAPEVPEVEEDAFTSVQEQEVQVKLYYFNEDQDMLLPSNQQKNVASVLPVRRTIMTSDPILDTLNLLMQGSLSDEEVDEGFITEFPRKDFMLTSTALSNGTLTLTFDIAQTFGYEGSEGGKLLKESIRRTALQFAEVDEVVFEPAALFE